METKGRILVIDDETGIRKGCVRVLEPQGFTVETASSFQEGLEKVRSEQFDLVLLDLMLSDGSGVDLIEPIHNQDPETIAVVITGYATLELAVETIKRGAYNFISKPFSPDVLLLTVQQGMEKRHLSLETRRLRELEQEQEGWIRAREEAERLDKFKTSFMLMVTHELRSPVAGAQSLVRTLLHGYAGALNDQQNELLRRVEKRLDLLLELINDLLTLSASKTIEAGSSPVPLRLAQIIQRISTEIEGDARQKQVELVVAPVDQGLIVSGIEKDLETVLRNLLHNAIKYTPQGGTVHLQAAVDGDRVRITVRDTGIGIPADDLPRIGEEFFRARNAHLEGIPGTGLGISIVRQLVARQGGNLEVSSEVGRGSTFTVSLSQAS